MLEEAWPLALQVLGWGFWLTSGAEKGESWAQRLAGPELYPLLPYLVGQLLDPPLILANALLGFSHLLLLHVQLSLQLTHLWEAAASSRAAPQTGAPSASPSQGHATFPAAAEAEPPQAYQSLGVPLTAQQEGRGRSGALQRPLSPGGCPLPPYPGLQLLDLLLAPLESNLLRFVQAHLQVLDGLLHVLLHPLQVCTCVLLLLQLLCHHGSLQGQCTNITLRPGSPARHRDSMEELRDPPLSSHPPQPYEGAGHPCATIPTPLSHP